MLVTSAGNSVNQTLPHLPRGRATLHTFENHLGTVCQGAQSSMFQNLKLSISKSNYASFEIIWDHNTWSAQQYYL